MIDPARLTAAYRTAHDALLAERHPDGYWLGELSSSALSTATAVSALSLVGGHAHLTDSGLHWLAEHQNADGGWGDTVKSFSNISTTLLCIAAFRLAGESANFAGILNRAADWLKGRYGATSVEWAEAVRQRYGKDRTFSVPILMNCALAGLLPWAEVPALPFELACLPQSWYRFARLPVVSYALPALIAIGQAVFHHRAPHNPLLRMIRRRAIARSLRVLRRIQPSSGGYLEATPLTSFVVMALASTFSPSPGFAGKGLGVRAFGAAPVQHPHPHPLSRKAGRGEQDQTAVIASGVEFLRNSMRPDGSWPIDSNLSVWVTTLAINALATINAPPSEYRFSWGQDWLLDWQCREQHPFTGIDPGGWGWSYLPGSVPDSDDTPGALLALEHFFRPGYVMYGAIWPSTVSLGISWLLLLQNSDGGWPTFCRGWGKLPFDRSGCDLTAHAIRALSAWLKHLPPELFQVTLTIEQAERARQIYRFSREQIVAAIDRGRRYLERQQRPDGSWLPLWFGNQHAPDDINPTYGTAKVLAAYRDLGMTHLDAAQRGIQWLLANQNDDGGWGGGRGTPSSVEETALAVEVLIDLAPPEAQPAVERGLLHLSERVETGGLYDPSPIGFYFAKLWYFEKMYPIVFAVAALGRALRSPRFGQPPSVGS